MLVTLIFPDEAEASTTLQASGKQLTDSDIKFSGFITYPKDFGPETTSSFFVIISTDLMDVPAALMAHEYDYSQPVGVGITIRS